MNKDIVDTQCLQCHKTIWIKYIKVDHTPYNHNQQFLV